VKSERIHNVLFTLIVAVIVGVTAWAICWREPWLFSVKPLDVLELAREAGESGEIADSDVAMEKGELVDEEEVPLEIKKTKKKGKVELMIDSGKLSKHPARYYRKVEK